MGDMTKTDEYRSYRKNSHLFIYPDEVMEQIKAHNPAYTKVTTAELWLKHFTRVAKRNEKPFAVNTPRNPSLWLLDISQTSGKQPPSIYQNISGKAEHYEQILACLTSYSDRPVLFQEGSGYYSGIGQDSFIENGKIVLRPALSESQIIFAIVREIIRQNQTSAAVVEAASYMVCRHIGVDTSAFSFGYLLEHINFDESLKALKNTLTQDTIIKEAELLIGYLNANLPFLNGTADSESIIEIKERQEAISKPKPEAVPPPPRQPITQVNDRTETIHGIEFRFIKMMKEFLAIRPDRSITPEIVREYSYFDVNMFIIGHAVAVKLFSKKREIYILYKDNTEVRAESLDDINRHHGLFGITKEDWLIMQTEIAQNGLNNERVKINRWGQLATKEINQKGGGRRISENIKRDSTGTENTAAQESAPEETLQYNADGSVIAVADDVNYKELENPSWVKPALAQLIDGKKYKSKDIPFFVKQGDTEPSYDMLKINEILTHYSAIAIPKVLASCVVVKNGQKTCEVIKAVHIMCDIFNTEHIARAIEEYWLKLKIPFDIKTQFSEHFKRLKKKLDAKAQHKKPSPDDNMRRVKALSGDNPAQNGQDSLSKNEMELIHIIESYKKKITAKPKPKSESIIPALSSIKTKAR